MFKLTTSLFFSILFIVFISAPTIIAIVDDNIDVSIFYANSEEEEKGHEKSKDKEVLLYELSISLSDFSLKDSEHNLNYACSTYQKPHLNLISPPPEQKV